MCSLMSGGAGDGDGADSLTTSHTLTILPAVLTLTYLPPLSNTWFPLMCGSGV